ncbi:hypothetical protein HK097_002983 [Rhizophlyctis rosea]|uniref:AMP-activated protein kinase glycogen-binding domain-containing protein n=1 Tax=Rhizophlyctis rosea TaxID=64517 RepID=A0AAD5SMK6_9FUNG|nr:hypothetical protein HK097_002983 [Rhizophlyctis rosea]
MPPITFTWPHGGNHVIATGSFDDWTQSLQLHPKSDDPRTFEGTVSVADDVHEILYKFVVDGAWRADESEGREKRWDGMGGWNNVLNVQDVVKAIAYVEEQRKQREEEERRRIEQEQDELRKVAEKEEKERRKLQQEEEALKKRREEDSRKVEEARREEVEESLREGVACAIPDTLSARAKDEILESPTNTDDIDEEAPLQNIRKDSRADSGVDIREDPFAERNVPDQPITIDDDTTDRHEVPLQIPSVPSLPKSVNADTPLLDSTNTSYGTLTRSLEPPTSPHIVSDSASSTFHDLDSEPEEEDARWVEPQTNGAGEEEGKKVERGWLWFFKQLCVIL